jgi:hypothetical protein
MFNMFDVFSAHFEDQTREFEAALLRIRSRRLATVVDDGPMAASTASDPAGIEPASTHLTFPARSPKGAAKRESTFA